MSVLDYRWLRLEMDCYFQNLSQFNKIKGFNVQVSYLCAAKAIVTAVSVLNKDRWTSAELQSLRKSKKVQEREALKLRQDSGVPVKDEGNDFADLKKFAKHLKVGLKVFSGDVLG